VYFLGWEQAAKLTSAAKLIDHEATWTSR